LLAFVSLLLVGSIGVLDVVSGPDVSISPFYLLAVILGTWRGGPWIGMLTVVASALTYGVADVLLSEPYLRLESSFASAWIPFWNGVAQGLVLLAATLAVSKLQTLLQDRLRVVGELQRALGQIRTLESLISVCAWCKRICDESDANQWKIMERYISEHTDTKFSHGMCPDCCEKVWKEEGLTEGS
jgi:hypothetical protein